jgi:hypothetical protein
MGFVKLDSGILDSTLWMARAQREIFITALLMAEPMELQQPMEQLEVNSLKSTGFIVPPGWYGFVHAAGVGIIARALVSQKEGLDALEILGSPEQLSRSQDFGGRRLVRVDGGFVVLNFIKYRDRDYTTAERSRRYRERKKQSSESRRDIVTSHRDITQALALAEETAVKGSELENTQKDSKGGGLQKAPSPFSQSDFDERDWRKIAEARKMISAKMGAAIGGEGLTEQQFYQWVSEESGVTIQRVMKLFKQNGGQNGNC